MFRHENNLDKCQTRIDTMVHPDPDTHNDPFPIHQYIPRHLSMIVFSTEVKDVEIPVDHADGQDYVIFTEYL